MVPFITLYLRFILYPLIKQSMEDLREAWEDDTQDFTYDIKHVHLN
jgi:hypothetical protein